MGKETKTLIYNTLMCNKVDLSPLEYGIDYWALPPRTIVWAKPYGILFPNQPELTEGSAILIHHNGCQGSVNIIEINSNGFTYV